MTSKKNEIRTIDDLDLKNVSGGFMPLVFLITFCIIGAIGVSIGIAANPPSGTRGSGS